MVYLTKQEIKRELTSMLFLFDSICKDFSLRYSLSDGTLLGAVRHQGMIPWDDDVDVYMPRPDYERLIGLTEVIEDVYGLKAMHARNNSLPIPFLKLCNTKIRAQEDALLEKFGDEYLWMDVFPIDGAPSEEALTKKEFNKRQRRVAMLNLCILRVSRASTPKAKMKRLVAPILRAIIDPYALCRKIDKTAAMHDFEDARRVTPAVYGWWMAGRSFSKEGFLDMVDMPFEGKMLKCMSCWDEYLSMMYGDYMTPPPPEKQVAHTYKAWYV